jgi:hypothetical protein
VTCNYKKPQQGKKKKVCYKPTVTKHVICNYKQPQQMKCATCNYKKPQEGNNKLVCCTTIEVTTMVSSTHNNEVHDLQY